MQLLSAHAALAFALAFVLFAVMVAIGVPPLLAIVAGGAIGSLLVRTVLRDTADRAERWLNTPK